MSKLPVCCRQSLAMIRMFTTSSARRWFCRMRRSRSKAASSYFISLTASYSCYAVFASPHKGENVSGQFLFGSVRVCACVSVRLCVGALLFDLWPWFLAWGSTLTLASLGLYVKVLGQGQTVKIVCALPFEPVVRSGSILGLGLPSSANGNCEWPLPVHCNRLFVNNQGAFARKRSISFNY